MSIRSTVLEHLKSIDPVVGSWEGEGTQQPPSQLCKLERKIPSKDTSGDFKGEKKSLWPKYFKEQKEQKEQKKGQMDQKVESRKKLPYHKTTCTKK